eukprot:1184676-Rhodomonas_salina.2
MRSLQRTASGDPGYRLQLRPKLRHAQGIRGVMSSSPILSSKPGQSCGFALKHVKYAQLNSDRPVLPTNIAVVTGSGDRTR